MGPGAGGAVGAGGDSGFLRAAPVGIVSGPATDSSGARNRRRWKSVDRYSSDCCRLPIPSVPRSVVIVTAPAGRWWTHGSASLLVTDLRCPLQVFRGVRDVYNPSVSRVRYPRVLDHGKVVPYDEDHARANYLLHSLEHGKYKAERFQYCIRRSDATSGVAGSLEAQVSLCLCAWGGGGAEHTECVGMGACAATFRRPPTAASDRQPPFVNCHAEQVFAGGLCQRNKTAD